MSDGEPERRILVQQNIDLRRKLEEEHQSYKRKLSNYQEGQQKQAQLVQKLQEKVRLSTRSKLTPYFTSFKVVQYKRRCSELEVMTEQQKVDMDRVRVPVSHDGTEQAQHFSLPQAGSNASSTTSAFKSRVFETNEEQDASAIIFEEEKQK